MNKLLLCFVILIITNAVFGQSTFRKNTLYGELAGNGLFLSINYERQLSNKPGLGIRVGAGHASSDEKFRLTIPISANYLINLQNNKSFIDAGIGATWSEAAYVKSTSPIASDNSHIVSFVPSIGYRHQANWGLMTRIGFAPVINSYRFIPSADFCLGMSF